MENRVIQQQLIIEHETLAHVVSALRTTVGWKFQRPDFSRKLSSLQFVGESFDRHLKRLLDLEEADGYLSGIVADRPELSESVHALHAEHLEFRTRVDELQTRLRAASSTDLPSFTRLCDELSAFLDKLDEHHRKETDLLQEALLRDEGGEG
jgi:hypothetical protein